MKEIINLHLGHCGIRVGYEFWKLLAEDHGLAADGRCLDSWVGDDSFFREVGEGVRQPRAVLIDREEDCLDWVAAQGLGRLFQSDQMVAGKGAGKSVYPKARDEVGTELKARSLDAIRHELEQCDSPTGFLFTLGLSGGTGSGLGDLLMESLKDSNPKLVIAAAPVLSSFKLAKTTMGVYNEVLAFEGHLEHCDLDLIVDNPSLFDIEQRRPRKDAGFVAANKTVAQFLANTTSAFRFPAVTNQSLRKLTTNLVPYQRLHFCMPSLSPLFHSPLDTLSVPYVFEGLNSHLHCLCSAQLDVHYTVAYSFRGPSSISEIYQVVQKFYDENSECFVQWIPQCLTVTSCERPCLYSAFTASCIRNGSGIVGVFDKMLQGFRRSVGRMAWFHHYRAEGMEDSELLDAEASLSDLMQEYEIQTDMEDPQLGQEE